MIILDQHSNIFQNFNTIFTFEKRSENPIKFGLNYSLMSSWHDQPKTPNPRNKEREGKKTAIFPSLFFSNQTLPSTSPNFSIYQYNIFGHVTKNFMLLECLKTCVYVNMDQ